MIGTPRLPTAGELREKIALQEESRVADGGGGSTKSWAAVTGGSSLSAKVTPTSGLERAAAMQAEGGEMFDVWVRYSSVTSAALTNKALRVVWRSRTLNIRAARNPDEKRVWLLLNCEEKAGGDGDAV